MPAPAAGGTPPEPLPDHLPEHPPERARVSLPEPRPHRLVGVRALVTTSIPAGGLGEVRVPARGGGTDTYGAYSSVSGLRLPAGTRVVVVEVHPPRTLIVTPEG